MPHTFETRIARLALWMSVPPALATLVLLWLGDYSPYLIALATLLLSLLLIIASYRIRTLIANQLHTLTNLLDGLNRGDYSQRGKRGQADGALAELVNQLNSLTDTLSTQRLQVRQSELLLQKVVAQINVAIITFDQNRVPTLMNPAACKLLGLNSTSPDASDMAQVSAQYEIQALLSTNQEVVHRQFPGGSGRYQIVVDHFISRQQTYSLLFVTNVQTLLREEERKAWQNLIRVISHEINNSLTPIASLSQTLSGLAGSPEHLDDMREGLEVIKERADSLQSFIGSYRQLAKLPAPDKQPCQLDTAIQQCIALYPTQAFHYDAKPVEIHADATQLQQVLINLTKNAIEAQQDETQTIAISVRHTQTKVEIDICDQGPGVTNPDNLFTPFYTTKPQGSGIGLLLCRQVLEAHEGQLNLSNRPAGGCCATLELPVLKH